jgi:hypothetical protein
MREWDGTGLNSCGSGTSIEIFQNLGLWHKVFKCLSKLLDFNILKIIGYNCESLKAIQNNINEQTFKQLKDLRMY